MSAEHKLKLDVVDALVLAAASIVDATQRLEEIIESLEKRFECKVGEEIDDLPMPTDLQIIVINARRRLRQLSESKAYCITDANDLQSNVFKGD